MLMYMLIERGKLCKGEMLVSEILWIHTAYVLCLLSSILLLLACQLFAVLPIQFCRILFILDLYHRLIALNTLIILAFLADSLLSLTLMFTVKFIFSFVVSRVFRN